MTNEERAKKFIAEIIEEDLDVGGDHYSPDLRDCMADHREFLEAKVVGLLNRIMPA